MRARTEIHEAWTNISLAGTYLSQDNLHEAQHAISDAEFHYNLARTYATDPSILDRLAKLRAKLDQIKSAVGVKSKAAVNGAC